MSDILYHYCRDDNGNLVAIEDVTEDNRHEKRLCCLSCGNEMIPKLGKEREHHFAHKTLCNCNGETYLHKLAKIRLRKEFERNPASFLMQLRGDLLCENHKTCFFHASDYCKEEDKLLPAINLHKWYDTIQEEVSINGFVADLLLTSKEYPERRPLLIEVVVTHRCDISKIRSGLKIIEVPVRSEEQIEKVCQVGFIQPEWRDESRDRLRFYDITSTTAPTVPPEKLYFMTSHGRMSRFCSYANGGLWKCIIDDCRNINRRIHTRSVFELNINVPGGMQLSSYPEQSIVIEYLHRQGCDIKSCAICKYNRRVETWMSAYYMCILYKSKGTPKFPKPDYANTCLHFRTDAEFEELRTLDVESVIQQVWPPQ